MYFCYGWPKVLRVHEGDSAERIIYMSIQGSILVIVSSNSIQTWTAGQVCNFLLEIWFH